jgi:hypothetical protein
MTLEEFSKDLREDVQTYAVTDGNFSRSAFVDCCASRLQEAGVLSDLTPCFYKGTGEKKRALELDGYSFDELDDSFSVVIADYRKFTSEASITRTDANALFGRVKSFIAESLSGRLKDSIEDSHPAHGLVLELLQRRSSTVRSCPRTILREFLATCIYGISPAFIALPLHPRAMKTWR